GAPRRRAHAAPDRLVQRHRLAPLRDVRRESERADLRLERGLGGRVAVRDEDRAREARVAGALPVRERADPREKLGLVGMRGEAADRDDAATDVARGAVDDDLRRAALEVRAERALALIAHEEQRRG